MVDTRLLRKHEQARKAGQWLDDAYFALHRRDDQRHGPGNTLALGQILSVADSSFKRSVHVV